MLTKKSRITGKWKLTSVEGVNEINPEIEKFMELKKDKVDGEYFKACFTNYQSHWIAPTGQINFGYSLFNSEGKWKLYNDEQNFYTNGSCVSAELTDKKEMIYIEISLSDDTLAQSNWKILKLKNKELKMIRSHCLTDSIGDPIPSEIYTFEKI